jgi:hypothetical protein
MLYLFVFLFGFWLRSIVKSLNKKEFIDYSETHYVNNNGELVINEVVVS